jgi:hypothetical protein
VGETPWRFKSSHPHSHFWRFLGTLRAQNVSKRKAIYAVSNQRANRSHDERGNVTTTSHPIARGQGSERARVDAYLDTCLVSGLAERDIRPVELEALRTLLRAHKARRIALVTSHVTHEEIGRMSEAKRAPHEDVYALLEDLPEAVESRRLASLPLLLNSVTRDDDLFAELKTMVPDLDDARHLFQAIKNGADYFVTDDERTIVSRADKIEAHYPIKVRLPSQLVAELAL